MLRSSSRRARDLIRLGALGLSDKEIATELGLSVRTVQDYFADLRYELGPFPRTALPGMALHLGLLTVEEVTAPAAKLLAKGDPCPSKGPTVEISRPPVP